MFAERSGSLFVRSSRANVDGGTCIHTPSPSTRARVSDAAQSVVEMLERRQLLAAVTGSAFNYLTAPQNLTFDFNTNVSSDLSLDDLVVDRLSNNSTLARANQSLSYNTGNNKATVTFPGEANQGITGMMPDGNFQAIISEAGIPGMTAEHLLNYFFLIADANRDRAVSSADETILLANFGGSNKNFGHGNFDLDGDIDLDDYTILSANFGRQMPAPITTENTLSVAALSSSANRLTWTRPGEEVEVDGYRVFVSTDGANFTQIAQLAANVRTYDHTGLTDGTKYWYRVRPYTNAEGNSTTTNKVSAVTVLPAPTAGSGYGNELDASIDTQWVDNSTTEQSFEIQRATNDDFSQNLVTFTSGGENVPGFQDGDVEANVTYYYRARAVNSMTTSSWSVSVAVIAANPLPHAPNFLYAVAGADHKVDLRWNDNSGNESGFELQRSDDPTFAQNVVTLATVSPNTTALSDNVPSDGTFYFRVRALRTGVAGSVWVRSSATAWPSVAPASVIESTASTLGSGHRFIDWVDGSNNETGFEILRSVDPSFSEGVTSVGTVSFAESSFLDTTSGLNDEFFYRVRAVNDNSPSGGPSTRAAGLSNAEALGSPVATPEIQILRAAEFYFGRRVPNSVAIDPNTNAVHQFYAGMAVHVRPNGATLDAYDPNTCRYTWAFNDNQNGGKYNFLHGPAAAHVYEFDGKDSNGNGIPISQRVVRTITLNIDAPGANDPAPVSIEIYVKPATSNKTVIKVANQVNGAQPDGTVSLAAGLSALAADTDKSNLQLLFARGQLFNLTAAINLRSFSNVLVGDFVIPNTTLANTLPVLFDTRQQLAVDGAKEIVQLANPVFSSTSGMITDVTEQARGVQFRNLRFDSRWDANDATLDPPTIGQYDNDPSQDSYAPSVAELHGVNILFQRCEFEDVTGLEQDGNMSGLLLQQNSDVKRLHRYFLYYNGATQQAENLVLLGNSMPSGSLIESAVRIPNNTRFVYLYDNVLNGGSKSAVRLFSNKYVLAERNTLSGSDNWIGPQPDGNGAPAGTIVAKLIMDGNTVKSGNFRLTFGLRDSVIRNNVFTTNNEKVLWVKGEPTAQKPATDVVQDVWITNNTILNVATNQRVFYFNNPGFVDPNIRIRRLRLANNLVARTDGTTDDVPTVQLDRLGGNPALKWTDAIKLNNTGDPDRWFVANNVYRAGLKFNIDGTADFGFDNWRDLTGSADVRLNTTVNGISFLPADVGLIDDAVRDDRARFDYYGIVSGTERPATAVIAGAVQQIS